MLQNNFFNSIKLCRLNMMASRKTPYHIPKQIRTVKKCIDVCDLLECTENFKKVLNLGAV